MVGILVLFIGHSCFNYFQTKRKCTLYFFVHVQTYECLFKYIGLEFYGFHSNVIIPVSLLHFKVQEFFLSLLLLTI